MRPAQKTVQEKLRAQKPDLLRRQLPNSSQEIEAVPREQK